MANIGCDLCEQEQAVLLQSNLGNGDTVAVGAGCLLQFYEASVSALREALSPPAFVAATLEPDDAGTPEKPSADSTEPPDGNAGPMDTYEGDVAYLRETYPHAKWRPGEHGHRCPGHETVTHVHRGGGKQHEHPCMHQDDDQDTE